MNYYDAQQIRLRHAQRQPVSPEALAEANAFIERTRKPGAPVKAHPPLAIFHGSLAPGMDLLCQCGLRYGMHRVGDYACPNPKWRPGNGEPQWMPMARFKFSRGGGS